MRNKKGKFGQVRKRNQFVPVVVIALLLLCLFLLCGCRAEGAESSETSSYSNLSDLENKRIGVTTGSIQAGQVEEQIPGAKLYYYSTVTDMLSALRAGKIDAFANAEIIVRYMMTDNNDLTYLEEKLDE